MSFFDAFSVNPMMLPSVLAGLLAALACGAVGPYVITRRIVFLAGAIAHIAVGGVGAVIFLRRTWPDLFGALPPFVGAITAALLGAALISVVHDRARERVDTLIGALWATGMSVGILLVKMTDGYDGDLLSYLFGNIALMPWSHFWMLLIVDVVIIAILLATHKSLLAVCLDPQHASLQGVPVPRMNLLLLLLTALTVVALMQAVGLILVLALLTLPAATAGRLTQRMIPMIVTATIIAMLATTVPRIAVYGTRISAESAIVLTAAAIYLGSLVVVRRRRGRRAEAA